MEPFQNLQPLHESEQQNTCSRRMKEPNLPYRDQDWARNNVDLPVV